ncbi:sugar ABC transporter permease [Paremcibacter congregatus]|uniref:Sugar ABC transporter permease n=2 Tax=Paremcibacter congregatus TaxID=2043170 RepID=A0A2G4YS07_9PROT|nr:sugar ABC transporter permease [Paremcibacter congregatus]QDE29274.1 carbohydrate ABC transporter permease [Paremcibacter congregatus]
MYGLALTWLYPYIWMIMASLKPTPEIYHTDLFSGSFTLENYQFLFESAEKLNRPFLKSLFNSFFVTLTVTASVVMTSAFIGYAMAKIDFRGRRQMNDFILFQMVVPGMMLIIPQFILIKQLGLINSYSAMILPVLMSGWGIFMVAQTFRGTPNDYIDAAKLDRASLKQIILNVMLPLNKAIVAIVALFTFTGTWDNFMWPLIVISDVDKMPLSVLLATFSKQYGIYVGPVMAGSVLQALPLIILFITFRRYFLQGMSLSLK